MAGGMVDEKMVADILQMVNGHFWKGLAKGHRRLLPNKRAAKEFEKQ